MSESTHSYTATLLVDADEYPLGIRRAGRITLDEGTAPHVSADLDLTLPNEETLDLLDPRGIARVRIDVDAIVPSGPQSRSFDLALRRRRVRHDGEARAGSVLASDEALLGDFRRLEDDRTPRTHESSLRAVVDYVLGEAIPGAELEADPSGDADVTAYFPVTNLHPNPRPMSPNPTGYGLGFGATSLTFTGGTVRWTPTSAATDSNLICAGSLTAFRVTPGKSYVFAVEWASANVNRTARAAIQWRNNGSASTLETVRGAVFAYNPSNYQRMHVIATAPEGAEYMYPLVLTSGTAAPVQLIKEVMVYEGDELVPFFDGATPDTAFYECAWADSLAPNASSSTRKPLVDSPTPESLVWRAGKSALDFLHPLVQSKGFRLVCDEQRRWTLRGESYTAPGSLTIREGINLIEGEDVIDRELGLWFDAQVTVYTFIDDAGIQQRRVDSYALNDPPSRVNLVEVSAPYPGPGRSEYAVRRAQGRGREVTATLLADWRARAEQPTTIRLVGAPTQIGETSRVEFDLSNDRMTISTRTTDTPESAWLLIPEDEAWLDQPIGESWTEEVI